MDVGHELLALYARLFGVPDLIKPLSKPPPTANSAAPSKIGGTLRSFAGSMRPRSTRHSVGKDTYTPRSVNSTQQKSSSGSDRQRENANGQAVDVPIAITVTNEDGVATEKARPQQHQHLPFKLRGQQGDWREIGNLRSSKSAESMREMPAPIPEESTRPTHTNAAERDDNESGASPDRARRRS